MVIKCSRKILNEFRKLCRAKYPIEVLGILRGFRYEHGVEVTDIKPMEGIATEFGIHGLKHKIPKSKIAALRAGEDWLGTIHSHCATPEMSTCAHLSEADVKSALLWGETVCGVVYVYLYGKRTEVAWYEPKASPVVALI